MIAVNSKYSIVSDHINSLSVCLCEKLLTIGIVLFERSMGVHLVSSGESLVVAWESGGLLLLALVPVVGPVLGWTPLYLLLLLLLVRGVGT